MKWAFFFFLSSLAMASKETKPVMIDFFGIWCPPCNQLEETVFETPAFLEKVKKFKFLKVDADKESSWKLKDRYKVGGYPTVIFTNPKGEEIYRVIGYRPLPEFLRIMEMVLGAKGKSIETACKSERVDDLVRCVLSLAERKEVQAAEKAISKLEGKLKLGTVEYTLIRNAAVDIEGLDDAKRDSLERLIRELPQSPLAVLWATEYLELFSDKSLGKPKQDLIELVLKHFDESIKDPNASVLGMTDTDALQMRANLLSVLHRSEEAKKAWLEAAAVFEQKTKLLPKGVNARGFTLERISCLEEAGLTEEALKLVNIYREKYPNEFTFHFKAAQLLKRQKKYNESLPIAEKAYKNSYGDNKIRSATLMIELLATIPDKARAKSIYDAVVKEIPVDKNLKVRTSRYLDQMKAALQKI